MKYFPKYRIYSIVGYLFPAIASFYIATYLDIHWILEIIMFIILYPTIFILEILVWVRLGKIWNSRQKSLEKEKSGESDRS